MLGTALEQGISVTSRRDGSSPQEFPDREAPVRNSGGASCPACTMTEAITRSLNTTFYGLAYEVGPEFVTQFHKADAANARFFAPSEREDHARFDLAGYVIMRVRQAGIRATDDLGLCTYAEPERVFSYRRMTKRGEDDYGRHINAIALVG